MMEINEEIRMISFEIKHLRLPHKMKQYQRFRSRIVSIQNLIEKQKKENQNQSQSMQKCFERNRIEFDNQRSNENQNDTFDIDSNIGFDSNEKNQEQRDQFDRFDDIIENLFEQLNQKVICGVQQCFLCGSCSSDGTKSIRYGENDDDEKNEEIRLKKIHQEECLNSEQNSTKEIDLDRIGSESKLTTISNNDSSEDLKEIILSSYDRNKMNHRTTASLLETEKDGESETESDFTSKNNNIFNLDDQENLVERSNVCEKAQHHHHSTNSKLTDPIQNGTSKIATKQNNGNNDDLQRILSMTNQQFEMLDKEILDRFLKMVIEANNLNDKFSRYDHNNNVVGDDNNHRTISFNNSAANLKNFTFKSNTGDGYKASKITDEEIDESKQKLIDSLKQQLQRYNQKC
ncbi:uncharacterized protein NH340_JMT06751 [Sarcoptes scabiei]|nr:uncharacterized protein NH340_JMT06751 [Sarcoptes scabiei]